MDPTSPVITVAASSEILWPPHGQRVPVTMSGAMTDAPEGSGVQSAAYQVMDEYGQSQPSGSIIPGADGRYAFTVRLQASRHGNDRDGRDYTIAVSATDTAGNSGVASTTPSPSPATRAHAPM